MKDNKFNLRTNHVSQQSVKDDKDTYQSDLINQSLTCLKKTPQTKLTLNSAKFFFLDGESFPSSHSEHNIILDNNTQRTLTTTTYSGSNEALLHAVFNFSPTALPCSPSQISPKTESPPLEDEVLELSNKAIGFSSTEHKFVDFHLRKHNSASAPRFQAWIQTPPPSKTESTIERLILMSNWWASLCCIKSLAEKLKGSEKIAIETISHEIRFHDTSPSKWIYALGNCPLAGQGRALTLVELYTEEGSLVATSHLELKIETM